MEKSQAIPFFMNLIQVNSSHQAMENSQLDGFENLEWSQTALLEPHFDLHNGSKKFGSIVFYPSKIPQADDILPSDRYNLKFTKFPLPKVIFSELRNSEIIATFEPDLNGNGFLRFNNGPCYLWKTPQKENHKFSFLSFYDVPLIDFYPKIKWLKTSGPVNIHQLGRNDPQLSILLMVGWFLILVD